MQFSFSEAGQKFIIFFHFTVEIKFLPNLELQIDYLEFCLNLQTYLLRCEDVARRRAPALGQPDGATKHESCDAAGVHHRHRSALPRLVLLDSGIVNTTELRELIAKIFAIRARSRF